MIQEKRLINLFKDLCNINSPPLQEKECVQFTKTYLERIGLDVIEDNAGAKIGGNANNLIATLKGNVPKAPRIFLSAHFDTVEPTEGLIIEEHNGILRSTTSTILGADDKGGLAPAIEAVHALKESGKPHGDVLLLLSVAEEIGLKGASALEIEKLNLDFGYVLDTGPPIGSYVNRAARHDELKFTFKGQAAHAGVDPSKGINAIQVMSEAVTKMRLGKITSETTANLGMVRGGTAINIVCPETTLFCEARSTCNEELERQIRNMIEACEQAAQNYGAEVSVDHITYYQGYLVSENSAVVKNAQKTNKSLGLDTFFRTNMGGSDANIYNAKGIPTLVMATGMQNIHTHDEYISKKDLCSTANLCIALLLEAVEI